MNPTERASHPSRAQIETLLEFLERNPSIAKGFSRVPSARDATRKMWEKLSFQLNSLGGCVKTWKQWTKYWADKKSAVKKKGALRFRTRNKTGGGAEVVELSDIEERILALMGGEGFAVDDRHLEINPFEDTPIGLESLRTSTVESHSHSPSLLANQLIGIHATPQSTTEQHSTPSIVFTDLPDTAHPTVETPQQPRQYIECVPGTSHSSSRPSVVHIVSQSPPPRAQAPPCTPPRVGAPASTEMPTTPSGSGRHPQRRSLNVHRQLTKSPMPIHHYPNATTSSRRNRRRGLLSPPSQRQNHLTSLTERFLRVEEQRTEILHTLLDNVVARDRSTAQALQSVGNGLKLLAELLRK